MLGIWALGLALLCVALAAIVAARLERGRVALRFGGTALLVAWLTAGAGFKHDAALCDAHNIRRASEHLWSFRNDMLRMHPTLPDSARCYFWNIPYYIGFQLADGPALRTWYTEGKYCPK